MFKANHSNRSSPRLLQFYFLVALKKLSLRTESVLINIRRAFMFELLWRVSICPNVVAATCAIARKQSSELVTRLCDQ